jgi:hypothetical protein
MSEELLRKFARKVLSGYLGLGDEIGDIDGLDVQEWAEECGLLARVEVVEPCGESCGCAEYGCFPMICYRPTDALLGAHK